MIKNDYSEIYVDNEGKEFLKEDILDDNYPFYHLLRGIEKREEDKLNIIDHNLRLVVCKILSITFKKDLEVKAIHISIKNGGNFIIIKKIDLNQFYELNKKSRIIDNYDPDGKGFKVHIK